MKCPEWLNHVWAKSPLVAGEPGEPLVLHTFNVLVKLSDMIKLRPDLPEQIGFKRFWHCLFWAVWLHDCGKAASGFQASLQEGKPWPFRHEILSLAFLHWLEDCLTDEERLWVAASIMFHHKDIPEISRLRMFLDGSEDDPLHDMVAQLDDNVLQQLWRWFDEYAEPWIDQLGLKSYHVSVINPKSFNASEFKRKTPDTIRKYLASVLRWLHNARRNRQLQTIVGTIVLRGHTITSDHSASAHIRSVTSPLKNVEIILASWGKDINDLYPHQRECIGVQGSAILVSPTGSGKTEAAVLWACSQQVESGQGLPRLLYCLPYQASMNAMYDRLSKDSFPNMVGLEHSKSILALYRRFLDDDYSPSGALQKAKAEKNLGRLHYYPVRVLSPYQILKAPYRLKGYETLLTDCYQAAFVLDEIHAYDPGRLALILGMVKYLRQNYNARFFVMSATLPDLVVSKLYDALGDIRSISASVEIIDKFRRHKVFLREGDLLDEHWLAQVTDKAIQGKSVLVCLNTVKRAQLAFQLLKERLNGKETQIILLHGRFNGRDRLQKEQIIQNATGTCKENRLPLVLVATQVVEVSLDIDLDILYSDPAPLEALLQRFGRINRKKRQEWAPVFVFTEPVDGTIYKPELVQKTLSIVQANSKHFVLEDKVTEQLNQIYQGSILESWNSEYEKAYREFTAACLNTLWAFDPDKKLEDMFYHAFDSIDVLPKRLENEYQMLMAEGKPLEAAQLTVPISWKKYRELKACKMVYEGRTPIVNLNYDPEVGLQYE